MDRIDEAYSGAMGEAFMRKTRERLHWICSKVSGANVLDVGCSQGTLARLLAPLGKSVLGVDINPDAIAYASSKAAEMDAASRDHLRFVAANFMDFTPQGRFDTVIMGEILEHLAVPEAFVKKAHSCLGPGGTFVATVPFGINDDPDHRQTFYRSWIDEMIAPFFDVREIKIFGAWIGVVAVRRDRKVPAEKRLTLQTLKDMEAAFYAVQRPLVDDIKAKSARLVTQKKELDEAKKNLAAKTAEAKTAATDCDAQKARADKAAADYAKLKTDLANMTAAKTAADAELAKQKTACAAEIAKQKTAHEAECAKQKALLVAEQTKTKDLNSKLAATRNELAQVKNEALESRVGLNAERKVSDSQAEQINVLKAALQFATSRPQIEADDTRLLEYSQEVRELRTALDSSRDEAVAMAEKTGRLSGQVEVLAVEKRMLQSEINGLTAKLSDERETAKSREEIIAAKDREIDEVKGHAALCESENAKLADENKSLAERIGLLQDECEKQAKALESAKSDCASSEAALQRIAAERTGLDREVALLKTRLSEMESEKAALLDNLAQAGTERNALDEKIADGKGRQARLEAELGRQRKENAQLGRAIAQAKADLAESVSAAAAAQAESKAEADSLRKKLDDEIAHAKAALELARKKFEADLTKSRTAESAATKQVSELSKALSTLRSEYAELKVAKSKAVRLYNEKAAKFKNLSSRYKSLASSKLGRLTLAYWRMRHRRKISPQPVCPFAPVGFKQRFDSGLAVGLSYRKISELLKATRVACIMDEFTWKSYSPEANMIQLEPENYAKQLEDFFPEMIFVESAWRGVDNKWTNCVHKIPDELKGILRWAKSNGVPTVFWNKEDPVHFDTFKNVAVLFDFIFTYDFNCVQRYKQITGKDNAFFLPMAVQPTMFNPVEKYKRKDAFCFAGSYYKRYVERTKDLDGYVKNFPKYKNIEIYDRQFGKEDPNYMMPPEYAPYIKGNLPYDQIDRAYKGYNFAINLNSIKQANSVARRVFELLACNTVTVSNYSYGVITGFADLVITSDCADVIIGKLKKYTKGERDIEKLKLLGLRKVFSENTYTDRFAYICSKVLGKELTSCAPNVVILAEVANEREYQRIKESFERQSYNNRRLIAISGNSIFGSESCQDVKEVLSQLKDADFVGIMSPSDYYAESYLTDLVGAFRYCGTDAVVKGSYFEVKSKCLVVRSDSKPYVLMNKVNLRRGMMTAKSFATAVSQKPKLLRKTNPEIKVQTLSIDMFNYCANGILNGLNETQIAEVTDMPNINMGFSFREMQSVAESLKPQQQKTQNDSAISCSTLYSYCKNVSCKAVEHSFEDGHMVLSVTLGKGEHVYFPINKEFNINEIPLKNHVLQLNLETDYSSPVTCRLAYFFYDEEKRKISSALGASNSNLTVSVPDGTRYVKFQLRLMGTGKLHVRVLNFSHKPPLLPKFFNKDKVLCLTNHYPSYDNIYRNGFVHTRIKLYEGEGVRVPVFQLTRSLQMQFSEFEGVNVVSGNADYLDFVLHNNNYSTVVVHFLDKDMWEVLKKLPQTVRIIVWCHGADILKYTRRMFLYEDGIVPDSVIKRSEDRAILWHEVFSSTKGNIHFVFVSKWLKKIIEEDYGITIPQAHHTLIPNPIDTNTFRFTPKDSALRYKILSIRPYASRVYANDLTVKVIQELAKKPNFDKYKITLIGDGPLFDILDPLRSYKNVEIIKGFLRHDEILRFHSQNGIFLVPTRQDTHGVSRDEAMSSGLVPVTNDVAAVGEFVDDSCSILAPSEDYKAMARGIMSLVQDPERFKSMSRAAAARVRRQTASDVIVKQELDLILGRW